MSMNGKKSRTIIFNGSIDQQYIFGTMQQIVDYISLNILGDCNLGSHDTVVINLCFNLQIQRSRSRI